MEPQLATDIDLLLVEDDSHLRNRLREAFEDRGFRCAVAENVEQGKELLRSKKPARLVTDLKLGDGSGLELVKIAHELGGATETVVLSGYGTIATAVEAMKLGARNFLTKPAHADAILQAFQGRGDASQSPQPRNTSSPLSPSLEQMEWEYVSKVLAEHQGNVSKAATTLGMHRRTLQRKLSKQPGKLK